MFGVLLSSASSIWALGPTSAPQGALVGTASVSGVVLSADGRDVPIAGVQLTLGGQNLGPGLTAISDAEGRFTFEHVPTGSFTLTGARTSYVARSYGQRLSAPGTGVPFGVGEGQQLGGLVLRLPTAAVISGTVFDGYGRAVSAAPIVVLEERSTLGDPVFWSRGQPRISTGGDGTYRLFDLPPGTYVVAVYPPGRYLWYPGAGRGVFNADTSSEFVFHPGEFSLETAARITVGAGEERSGVDVAFPVEPKPKGTVQVQVYMPDGQPARNVSISTRRGEVSTSRRSADGSFTVSSTLPARFRIAAQAVDRTLASTSEVVQTTPGTMNVTPVLQAALTLTGWVAFEGTTLARPEDLTRVSLTIRGDVGMPLPIPVSVNADGTFKVSNVMPGRYRLTATVPGTIAPEQSTKATAAVWSLTSVSVGGREAGDLNIAVSPETVSEPIVVRFAESTRPAGLSGTLVDITGRPAAGYYVMVFPTDRQYWTVGTPRFPMPARAATDGTYAFPSLPAGSYHVVALTETGTLEMSDVFLDQLTSIATTVQIVQGERRVERSDSAGSLIFSTESPSRLGSRRECGRGRPACRW